MFERTTNAKAKPKTKAEGASQGTFPLFFQKPTVLDLKHHGKAGLTPTTDFTFAKDTNSIIINAIEFVEAAKHYPIIFTQNEVPLPAVVLGLEQDNYFINRKGQWQENTYIPAYVRKYPFIFMDASENKKFVLCIDESAPQYKKSGGKGTLPLYEKEKASALTKNALEFCTSYHNHHVMTRRFAEDIKAAGILTPSQSNAKLFNGREINLGKFQLIDEKKLNALPDSKIVEFHKKGWLPLIYFSLMSATHWKTLADLAGKRETK